MSRRWSEQHERGTVFALRLIHWIGLRIGRWAGRLILYPITLYFFITGSAPRNGSRQCLRRILAREPGPGDILRHFHCFSCTILDRLYLLAGQFDRFDVRIHNGELLLEQVRSGQGALLLGSHLGSFEILRVLGVSESHFPLKVLMNIEHNSMITRYMDALNIDIANTVIPIGRPETLLQVHEHLQRGYLIGALADRVVANDKITRCRFFDSEADFPAGPMLLAGALKCRVILFFGLYRGGRRYDIYFELLAEQVVLNRRQRDRDIQRWTQRYAERLERYTGMAPYNWFNFYDYWAEQSVFGQRSTR